MRDGPFIDIADCCSGRAQGHAEVRPLRLDTRGAASGRLSHVSWSQDGSTAAQHRRTPPHGARGSLYLVRLEAST